MRRKGAVLVTGADGFLGRHLARALAASGARVHGLVRFPPPRPVPGVRYHAGSVLDAALLARTVRKARPEVVYHLAAITRRGAPALARVNAWGTAFLCRAIAAEGIAPKLVLASSCEVYGGNPAPFREEQAPRPRSLYALSKRAAEEIVLAAGEGAGIPAAVLRFSLIYGPGQKPGMFLADLVRAARAGRRFPMTAGRQTRDFLHVTDAVEALRAAARSGASGVFNVAAGRAVSLRRAARTAERIVGRRFARIGAVPYRRDEIRRYAVDISKAERVLGWRPRVSLEKGLSDLLLKAEGA